MDLDRFASEREQELTDLAALYEPAVEEALQEDDEETRTGLLLVAIAAAFLLLYGEQGGEEDEANSYVSLFQDDMRAALKLLVPDSDDGGSEAQVERMTNWLATATLGASTVAAADSKGQPSATKTWVTMRDDAVRDIHAILDGTTKGLSELFNVKSDPPTKMEYPGQPSGPVEAWINCRCVLSIDLAPITAGAHELVWLENRRTPKVVSEGAKYEPTEAEGKIVRRRKANAEEEKTIAKGDWVRVNEHGDKPSDSGYKRKKSKVRPQKNTNSLALEDIDKDEIEEDDAPPAPSELIAAEDQNIPVHGVAAPEGISSGDGRMFAENALTWRDLPLPLTWQRAATEAHQGQVVVGRLDTLERRDDGMIHWTGELLEDVPETEEVINLIAQGALRGVSIDADKGVQEIPTEAEMEQALATGQAPPMVFTEARISGLTIVQIPAFEEAFISLGEDPASAVVADGQVETYKRGTGWVTHPKETKTLHDYWTKGKGAAKIRWGTGGDFTRCTKQLRKYIEPRFLNRTCAEWHHDALGYWPGELGKPGNNPKTALTECIDCEETAMIAASADTNPEMAPAISLAAAAPPVIADRSLFDDPKLDGPTALSIVGNHAFGHLATWGVCHIGIERQCVTAPKSASSYAHFHLGAIDTTDGELAVGTLTLGTGHADLNLSAASTTAHYDHTGTAVAKVRVGEDAHGIWFSGVICDGVTDDQVRTLKASGGLSGDWRSIGGRLELVAALAVNVPGFPVTRPALAASGEKQTALVAAGAVVATEDDGVDTEAIAAAVVRQMTKQQNRQAKLDSFADVQAEARAKRVAGLII